MTPILHDDFNATVAKELASLATATGLEVSDDRFFEVTCDHLALGNGLVAYALRFPESVVSCTSNSGTLTVVEYNNGQNDVSLCIHSTVYGIGVKYKGLPDHPHLSLILIVKQYTPDPVDDEDEDDRLFNQRRCVVDHAGREFWTNGFGEPL